MRNEHMNTIDSFLDAHVKTIQGQLLKTLPGLEDCEHFWGTFNGAAEKVGIPPVDKMTALRSFCKQLVKETLATQNRTSSADSENRTNTDYGTQTQMYSAIVDSWTLLDYIQFVYDPNDLINYGVMKTTYIHKCMPDTNYSPADQYANMLLHVAREIDLMNF